MNQCRLRLFHRVSEMQVYHAWINNAAVHRASSWSALVCDEVLFGCLAREAAYTHRGQSPRAFSPLEGHPMGNEVVVLDLAQVRQIRLALALCRERIACPATTTVVQEEAMRELRAAQAIFLEHEERVSQLQTLNRELLGGGHVCA
ncbi:hypothetical protein ACL7TT_19450 [Microbulbifer sp. 2304DJ12-6]|uniref:hypothetical protein n=1 Tax=Microbulbifer sp. 2304DJ12-6 TaxID=3233340 RepID=UPI0039AEE3D2